MSINPFDPGCHSGSAMSPLAVGAQLGDAFEAVKYVADNLLDIIALNEEFAAREQSRLNDRKAQRMTWGRGDTAAVMSFTGGLPYDVPAAILGPTQPASQVLPIYANRDGVTLYVERHAPAILLTADCTFTVDLAIPLVPIDVTNLKVGMIIDTGHIPKYGGVIVDWAPNGSWVQVEDWFQNGVIIPGSNPPEGPAGQIPPGVSTCLFNPETHSWWGNGNIFLHPWSHALDATGFEMGIFNNKGVPNLATGENVIWGWDVVGLGAFKGSHGFIQRQNILRGFTSRGAEEYAFIVEDWPVNPLGGFRYEASTGTAFQDVSGGVDWWSVARGVMELGRRDGIAGPNEQRFHSSGFDVDYDSRIFGTGGGPGVGQGSLRMAGASFHVYEATEANGLSITGGATCIIAPIGIAPVANTLVHAKGLGGIVQIGAAGGAVGFHGVGGSGQVAIPAALPGDGSASNAARDALLNAVRGVLNATGLTVTL